MRIEGKVRTELNGARRALTHRSFIETVLGSACLWAWGFLCYLSPSLFTNSSYIPGAELPFGFLVSQITVVGGVAIVVTLSKQRRIAIGRRALLGAAILISFATVALASALSFRSMVAFIACGVVRGELGSAPSALPSLLPRYRPQRTTLYHPFVLSFSLPFLFRHTDPESCRASYWRYRSATSHFLAFWNADAIKPT